MTVLKRLFEPIMVGRVELRNRLVMLAMATGYVEDGRVTQRLKDFLVARAKGGIGLVITPLVPFNFYGPKLIPGIYDDNLISSLRELTEIVHAQGGKVAAQLTAVGNRWARGNDVPLESVGPSEVLIRRGAERGRALTIEEIHHIVEEYGEGARRAREAGFDAVEFMAGAGLLLNQFISPATNKRQDEYGGNFENRMRFPSEIIDKARQKAGEDYTFVCRFSADEFIESGYDLKGGKKIASFLEKAGIHCLNIQAGGHDSPRALAQREVFPGSWAYLAEGIKKAVNVPVITAYRINDPLLAEQILSEGKADLIGMARALIADPEFASKAKEGRFDDICPCIACCRCLDQLLAQERPLELCSVNPSVGREAEYTIGPAPKSKKVFIIGGGPGGMEAARVAGQRGHKVTLWEKKDRLGGSLLFACIAPHKAEIENLINYLTKQIKKCGIDVRLGKEATLGSIVEGKPDAVIVATGSEPIIPDILGVEGANVATALEVLAGGRETGDDKVIIIGGGMVGCETAEFLAEKGRKVTILEMLDRIGIGIGASDRFVTMARLRKASVRMETKAKVMEITENGVRVMRGEESEFFEGDSIILAVGMKAKRELAQQLEGKVPALYPIGDCVEPQKIAEAIKAGFQVAREL